MKEVLAWRISDDDEEEAAAAASVTVDADPASKINIFILLQILIYFYSKISKIPDEYGGDTLEETVEGRKEQQRAVGKCRSHVAVLNISVRFSGVLCFASFA